MSMYYIPKKKKKIETQKARVYPIAKNYIRTSSESELKEIVSSKQHRETSYNELKKSYIENKHKNPILSYLPSQLLASSASALTAGYLMYNYIKDNITNYLFYGMPLARTPEQAHILSLEGAGAVSAFTFALTFSMLHLIFINRKDKM